MNKNLIHAIRRTLFQSSSGEIRCHCQVLYRVVLQRVNITVFTFDGKYLQKNYLE